jgi:anthranilate synthase/aminodeoxychorismate synthase-like glutamine amidotransferase
MVLMIDNYDSFTYNLVQYLREMSAEIRVVRNDALSVEDVANLAPQAIVLSPGPGRPEDAGICCEVIRRFSGRVPLLGVCLGHQAIGLTFGGKVIHAKRLMHGKTSEITTDGKGVFDGITRPITVMRYHSLAVEEATLPPELIVTARTEDGEVMGLRHRTHLTEGIQFHPESIMTPTGKRLLRNFLKLAGTRTAPGTRPPGTTKTCTPHC